MRALDRRRALVARRAAADLGAVPAPLPFGPFVIGVHVVADTRDPNTFYAVWLDTLLGPSTRHSRAVARSGSRRRPTAPARGRSRASSRRSTRSRTSSRGRRSGTCRCRSWRSGREASCTSRRPITTRHRCPETRTASRPTSSFSGSLDGGTTWTAPAQGQPGHHERRPVPAVPAGDEVRSGQRVLLRSPARPAGSARAPGELLHRQLPRALERRWADVAGDAALARLVGPVDQPADLDVRRVHRRLPGPGGRRLLRDPVRQRHPPGQRPGA